jgi:hypothetical protein
MGEGAGSIPIFSSPVRNTTPHSGLFLDSRHTLYDGKEPGKGSRLFGCMLNWDELTQSEHRAMFEDAKKVIAIRKGEAAILGVEPEKIRPKLWRFPSSLVQGSQTVHLPE